MNFKLIEEYNEDLITPDVLRLINSQMDFINSNQNTEQIKSFLKTHLSLSSGAKLLLLFNDDLVGFAFFNISVGIESMGKYIWLNELHISKKYQKQSYGSVIIKYLEDYAYKNNCLSIMGLVNSDNPATKFYQKHDYSLDKYSLFNKDIKKEKL